MNKAVLFDAGGTLIHMDRRFLIQTLNVNGVAADDALFLKADAVARREVSRIMRSGNPGTDASRWSAYARVLMHELRCEGPALAAVRAAVRERSAQGTLWSYIEEGTRETLATLKDAGFRLGVVSNADGRVAAFLENAGLARYFDVIVDSGVFGVEKPDPRIFLHACEALHADPPDTPYVGDVYEVDALGARSAGLTPIMLARNAEPYWDCVVIRSLSELGPTIMKPLSAP